MLTPMLMPLLCCCRLRVLCLCCYCCCCCRIKSDHEVIPYMTPYPRASTEFWFIPTAAVVSDRIELSPPHTHRGVLVRPVPAKFHIGQTMQLTLAADDATNSPHSSCFYTNKLVVLMGPHWLGFGRTLMSPAPWSLVRLLDEHY